MDREKEEEHLRLIKSTRDISNDTYEDRYREVNERVCPERGLYDRPYPGRAFYARAYPGRAFYARAYPVIPVYHLLAPHFPQPHPIWQKAEEPGKNPGCSSVPEP